MCILLGLGFLVLFLNPKNGPVFEALFFEFLVPKSGPIFGTNFRSLITKLIGVADFGTPNLDPNLDHFVHLRRAFGDQKTNPKKEPVRKVKLKFFLNEHAFFAIVFDNFVVSPSA